MNKTSIIVKGIIDNVIRLSIACIVILIFIKMIYTDINLDFMNNVDPIDIVAILLAFFSLGISLAFYFKTSETSNKFYDNTYHFTKNISEKLGRMDERVYEKMNSIEKSQGLYASIKNPANTLDNDYEEIKKQQELLNTKIESFKDEISELVKQLSKSDDEKIALEKELNNRIIEINDAQKKLSHAENPSTAISRKVTKLFIQLIRQLYNNNITFNEYDPSFTNYVSKHLYYLEETDRDLLFEMGFIDIISNSFTEKGYKNFFKYYDIYKSYFFKE